MQRHATGALGRAVLAIASGLATWLAFPPSGIWPLAVVGVAGFVLAVRNTRARRGAWLGLLFGVALFGPLLSWVSVTGPDVVVMLAGLEATAMAIVGAALAALSRTRAWPLWSAMLWVAGEMLRANVPFGGFPWGRLAFATAGTPYASYAALGGVALVSAAVALSGTLLAYALVRLVRLVRRQAPTSSLTADPRGIDRAAQTVARPAGARRPLAALAGAVLIPVVALLIPIGADRGGTDAAAPVTVALIQGNVPAVGLEFLGRERTVTRNHRDATIALADAVAAGTEPQPDVVIWPENSTDIDPFDDPETREVIEQAVDAIGVPILVGAILDGPGADYRRTAGVLWNPGTGPDTSQVYVKRHPVPFGEYIPLREQLLPLFSRLEQVGRQTFAGSTPGRIDLGPLTVGDVICFEIAYDGIVRDALSQGAGALVVQTNNATFGLSAQPEQQFAISRLRAVEYGRTVLVASTSGISGVIDPDGTVASRTAEFTRAEIVAQVTPQTGRTIASRLGPWPDRLISAGGVLALLMAIGAGRRTRSRRIDTAPAPDEPVLAAAAR